MGGKRPPSGDGPKPEASASTQPPKRRRVSRACDQCRLAREKCDGVEPVCFSCASLNRQCTWQEPKKKRGVQMGYIRTLEMALGWIFDKVPGSEKALHGLLTHESGQGRALLEGKDTGVGNRLHRRWRKSTVYVEVDRVLSGAEASQASGDKSDSEKDHETDHAKQYPSFIHTPSDQDPDTKPLPSTTPPEDTTNISTGDPNPIEVPSVSITGSVLKLPANLWRLLDIYFSYTHSWFPIIEKHVLLRTAYTYPTDGIQLQHGEMDAAGHAELWAVLTLASYQEEASHATQQPIQNPHIMHEGHLSTSQIQETARKLVLADPGTHNPRQIHALLLLALVSIAQEDLTAAWFLIGTASRAALISRLHQSPPQDRNCTLSHTYMGCFVLDTLIATRLNLPPHLRGDDTRLTVPHPDRDMDEWQPWSACPGFGAQLHHPLPSRNPSHSVSTLSALFEMFRVLSFALFPNNSMTSDESMQPANLRHLLQTKLDAQPYGSLVMRQERPSVHIPSVYVLRFTYLVVATRVGVISPEPSALLNCIENYTTNFGTCGLPPIISTYLSILSSRCPPSSCPSPEEMQQLSRIQQGIQFVWGGSSSKGEAATPCEDNSEGRFWRGSAQLPSSILAPAIVTHNIPPPIQQLPTPASSYADHRQPKHLPISSPSGLPANMYPNPSTIPDAGNIYYQHQSSHAHHPSSSSISSRHPVPAHPSHTTPHSATIGASNDPITSPSTSGATATTTFLPADAPTTSILSPSQGQATAGNNGSNTGSVSGGNTLLDYDAILDDIASIDRGGPDMIESDPQFMANLGFAPGSSLSELFSHEYIEFP